MLRPAEGVFLFHPRAMERLLRPRIPEGPRPRPGEVYYHLIPRQPFLAGLEQENPEALSVIEGLPLPDNVMLLPMPTATVLRSTPERTLLRDYWARRFEGELARAWQLSREDNQDQRRFGSESLAELIGETAMSEALDVLVRNGVPGASEGPSALCRAFVARTVRLRYFAPGTRGCHFPAVPDWSALDDWLEESGLDLPAPLSTARLPFLLERSRPAAACGTPAFRIPLPADLPYSRSDPDRIPVANGPDTPATHGTQETQAHRTRPAPVETGPTHESLSTLDAQCLAALRRGTAIRRRKGWLPPLGERLATVAHPLLRGLLRRRDRPPRSGPAESARPRPWQLSAGLHLLRSASAAAQRAELDGRYGTALRRLRDARDIHSRLQPARRAATPQASPVERLLDQRQWAAAQSLADTLAVSGRLPGAAADGLRESIELLALEPDPGRPSAMALLRHLERTLVAGQSAYYRIDLRAWTTTGRARQILPFQGTLKCLRSLDSARRLLEELPWRVADLDRLAAPLAAIAERLGERLEQQIGPRLMDALAAASFAQEGSADTRAGRPADPSVDRIALRRLADALTEIVRQRWHLRFSDVRDLLARDTLRLPDASLGEILRGDRLTRFDRAAALALPGVYRRGEIYVKGLQRLGAPLFGTPAGRLVLRLALGPWLAAYLGLIGLGLILSLFMPDPDLPQLATPTTVLSLTAAISLAVGTRMGRRAILGLWRAVARPVRFLLGPRLRQVLRRIGRQLRHWGPAAWLLERSLVQGLWDRLLAPLTTGLVPLIPAVAILWVFAPDETGGALWVALLALAFALGTLLRDTPGGRRWLDDLATGWQRFWVRLRHEGLADLVAAVMDFFKSQTRRLTEALERVRSLLDRRLDEPLPGALIKTLASPVWGAIEALVQFYAVVLIEPQTNPIKHFPVVTLGHKLMLPFLPALSGGLATLLSPVLPTAVALPLVALTVFLLPGLFGFLFWELKENRKLYAANRGIRVPLAHLGPHGETPRELMGRGFHGGTLPKAFDRLRKCLERQVRERSPDPRGLRHAALDLARIGDLVGRFAERDLALPLQAGCVARTDGLGEVEALPPQLSTQAVQIGVRFHPQPGTEPVDLRIGLAVRGSTLGCEARWEGPVEALTDTCRHRIAETVDWFARRCGTKTPALVARRRAIAND